MRTPQGKAPASDRTGLDAVKGLYAKRGWLYYQPPVPKNAPPGSIRPKAVALKTQDLRQGLDALRKLREQTVLVQAQRAGTLDEVVPRYLASRGSDTKLSRRYRKGVLLRFITSTGNPRLTAVDQAMIVEWRRKLSEEGGERGKPISGASLMSYTICLRAFFNWAMREGLIEKSPLMGMQRVLRIHRSRVQEFLTEEEREKLLAHEAPEPWVKLVLMLGFFAGLRDGEMLALRPQWIWVSEDGLRGNLTVQSCPVKFTDGTQGTWFPKSRRNRTIPLHPRLLKFLQEYGLREPWVLAPEKELVPCETIQSKRFATGRGLSRHALRSGVGRVTPHMLRHSFATHLSMKGVSLAEIAGLLGDTISVTEAHYAGYQPGKGNPLGCL